MKSNPNSAVRPGFLQMGSLRTAVEVVGETRTCWRLRLPAGRDGISTSVPFLRKKGLVTIEEVSNAG